MESHLVRHSGLYAFDHDFLRGAVQEEFLPSVEDQLTTHLLLADYFEGQQGMTLRRAAEWPWQLEAAQDWKRLEVCLKDRELFLARRQRVESGLRAARLRGQIVEREPEKTLREEQLLQFGQQRTLATGELPVAGNLPTSDHFTTVEPVLGTNLQYYH